MSWQQTKESYIPTYTRGEGSVYGWWCHSPHARDIKIENRLLTFVNFVSQHHAICITVRHLYHTQQDICSVLYQPQGSMAGFSTVCLAALYWASNVSSTTLLSHDKLSTWLNVVFEYWDSGIFQIWNCGLLSPEESQLQQSCYPTLTFMRVCSIFFMTIGHQIKGLFRKFGCTIHKKEERRGGGEAQTYLHKLPPRDKKKSLTLPPLS